MAVMVVIFLRNRLSSRCKDVVEDVRGLLGGLDDMTYMWAHQGVRIGLFFQRQGVEKPLRRAL